MRLDQGGEELRLGPPLGPDPLAVGAVDPAQRAEVIHDDRDRERRVDRAVDLRLQDQRRPIVQERQGPFGSWPGGT